MKLFVVLFAVVAAVAAYPGYDDPWQKSSGWQSSGWQPHIPENNGWHSGWQPSSRKSGWNSGWQSQPVVVKSGWSSGWQQPSHGWQQPSHGWQQPSHGWQQPSYGWQKPYHGWQQQHHVHHVDAIHVQQAPAVPALHPHPLKLDSHTHVTRIHYDHPKVHHPHLIGFEHHVAEPEIKFVKHEHGHGW